MYIRLEQDVVTPQFLQAIKIASELPGDQQNELAQFLLEEITDWEWKVLLSFVLLLKEVVLNVPKVIVWTLRSLSSSGKLKASELFY